MDPIIDDEVIFQFDFPSATLMKVYKSGKIERFIGTDFVPATLNSPNNNVSSKDVIISPEKPVSARLYLPTNINKDEKLPLLIYFHGGAFCMCSPFCALYHNHLTSLVSKANVVAVSVDYRLAPENPLPAAYEDSWDSLLWVASHSSCHGPESWLNDHVDFGRVFIGGDSAGANISHNIMMRAGIEKLEGFKIYGACIIHPAFMGKDTLVMNDVWKFTCPESSGEDDVRVNPAIDPRLSSLECTKILVSVAEKDEFKFRDAGWVYYEAMKNSGWKGEIEFHEIIGEGHDFQIFNPTCENADLFMEKMASFINGNTASKPST